MTFHQLFDPDSSTFTYVLADADAREAVIIDPVLEQRSRDLAMLEREGLRLAWILDTHVHADHVTGANALKAATGATTVVGELCSASGYDRALRDGDVFAFGRERLHAIATPGHTPGSTCFLWRDRVFTGDTLLIGGCGRTDFQDGDARALWRSIQGRLMTLPDATRVYPGHDYRGNTSSTVGAERTGNPRLAVSGEAEFIELMANLKLKPPARIDHAVPLNRIAGVVEEQDAPWAAIPASRARQAFAQPGARVADLREPEDREDTPMADAVAVDPEDIEALARLAAECENLYLVCRSGRKSMLAARALSARGVLNAMNVSGGLNAMVEAAA
jgi:sulfur dioxygenase